MLSVASTPTGQASKPLHELAVIAAREGHFLLAGPDGDEVNLASTLLTFGGQRLLWDSSGVKGHEPPRLKLVSRAGI